MITTVYRTGQMRVPNHSDYVLEHWTEFEARRPEGHLSRSEVLFASPDLQGGHCWLYDGIVLSNRGHRYRTAFNEITVESDNVRVYSVDNYNSVGNHFGHPDREQIDYINAYWENSMTLTEWMRNVGEDYYGKWEILLPESEVIHSRVVPYAELWKMYIEEGMDDDRIDALEELKPVLTVGETGSFSSSTADKLFTTRIVLAAT